jgi:low temperature requirement protein LtrA
LDTIDGAVDDDIVTIFPLAPESLRRGVERPSEGQDANRVTWTELFFDLVFVFAVTQVVQAFASSPTLVDGGRALLIVGAIWWLWIETAWVTNWLFPLHPAVRTMLIGSTLAVLVLAAAIPSAFGNRGLLFAGCLVVVQVGRSAFAALAMRRGQQEQSRSFCRVTIWFACSGVLWVLGAVAPTAERWAFWLAAVVIDSSGLALRFPVPGLGRTPVEDWQISGQHLAERAGQFVIIVLGETLVETGTAFADTDLSAPAWLALGTAFASSAAMFGLYFGHGVEVGGSRLDSSERGGVLARSVYSYLHWLIVVAVLGSAATDELLVRAPDRADPLVSALACGSAALFLISMSLFWLRIRPSRGLVLPLVGAGALLAMAICSRGIPPLVCSCVSALVLLVVLGVTLLVRPRDASEH